MHCLARSSRICCLSGAISWIRGSCGLPFSDASTPPSTFRVRRALGGPSPRARCGAASAACRREYGAETESLLVGDADWFLEPVDEFTTRRLGAKARHRMLWDYVRQARGFGATPIDCDRATADERAE